MSTGEKRALFVACGLYALFHVFGWEVAAHTGDGSPLLAALLMDALLIAAGVFTLAARFIFRDTGGDR